MNTAQRWLDLAALIDPAGVLAAPIPDHGAADWRTLYPWSTAYRVTPALYAVLAARGTLPNPPRRRLTPG